MKRARPEEVSVAMTRLKGPRGNVTTAQLRSGRAIAITEADAAVILLAGAVAQNIAATEIPSTHSAESNVAM